MGWHWADIMAALYKAGSSPAAIARAEGIDVSHSMVTRVIRGERTSHKVAYEIAATINVPTEKLWPGKYLTPPAYEEARNKDAVKRYRRSSEREADQKCAG